MCCLWREDRSLSLVANAARVTAALAVNASTGHVPHEEQPAAFMQAVEEFLAHLP